MQDAKQKARISEMARLMREHSDGCTAEHLLFEGFSRDEIEALGPAAAEEAAGTFTRGA